MTVYQKLVRDRIPEIIAQTGKVATFRRLDKDEARIALRNKLVEEAQEASVATADELLSELADLAEVLEATLKAFDYSQAELALRREERNSARGAFKDNLFLEGVDG